MNDNLDKIEELFDCVYGPRYAGGYSYFCKGCGKECNVRESYFECQYGRILPTYIICRYGCGRSWKLEIYLSKKLND